ncbi:hypothetical protein D3C81_914170 [compost metagenome]
MNRGGFPSKLRPIQRIRNGNGGFRHLGVIHTDRNRLTRYTVSGRALRSFGKQGDLTVISAGVQLGTPNARGFAVFAVRPGRQLLRAIDDQDDVVRLRVLA